MPKSSIRTYIRIFVSYGISLLFLGIVLRKISSEASIWEAIQQVRIEYFAIGSLCIAAEFIFQSLRWQSLLQTLGKYSLAQTLPSVILGHFYNTILPSRLGELIRPAHFSNKHGLPFMTVLGSCVIERVFDGMLVVLLLLFSLVVLQVDNINLHALIPAGISIYIIALLGILLIVKTQWIDQILQRFAPNKVSQYAQTWLQDIRKGFGLIKHWRHGFLVCLWSMTPLFLNILSNYYLLLSFPIPSALQSLSAACLISAAISLAYTIPSAPSSIGVFHYAIILALEAIAHKTATPISPIIESQFVLMSFVIYAASLIPDLLLGAIVAFRERHILTSLSQNEP